MGVYVLRRTVAAIVVLFVVVTMVFFLMRSIGGDPFRHGRLLGLDNSAWVKYGDPKPPAIQTNMERKYELDLPWYRQYENYLEGVATFDFGSSTSWRNRTVADIVREQAPRSIELACLALAIALGLGIPLGVAAALRPGGVLDRVLRVLAPLGLALPGFLVATVLIAIVSVRLGWLPTSGWDDGWKPKVLPAVTLALVPLASITLLVRAGTIDVLRQDWVQAARARGLRQHRVVLVHVLPSSLMPVLTYAGPLLGGLVATAFIVEEIFAVPGVARYYVAGVAARDLPVVMGLTVLLTFLVVVANLVVDIVHGLIDPRVREAATGTGRR